MTTEKVVEMAPYIVGYYKPTYEFTRIPEFMAIFDRQGELIGLTGPATSRQAAQDARLFALSPQLLTTLQDLYNALSISCPDTSEMHETEFENQMNQSRVQKALERARHILQQVEGNVPVH
jgi:hypothetical protein